MNALGAWLGKLSRNGKRQAGQGWSPKLEFGVASLVGNVREHNEDSYFVPGWPMVNRYAPTIAKGEGSPPMRGPDELVIVADGMGGQLAGERASQMAVEIVPEMLSHALPDHDDEGRQVRLAITEALARANREIMDESHLQGGRCSRMGTTVVLAHFRGKKAHVANLGDSRAYRFRNGRVERLTKDHTMAQALHDAGAITEDQLVGHKYQSVLYLHLGSPDAEHGPESVRELDLAPGDRFLLASDGLTGVVSDSQLAQVLAQYPGAQDAAVALADLALRNESRDNITCVIVNVT